MELQFSKTDLGRLVRGDWELVCGRWEQADRIGKWLTIKSDGLYLNDCEKAPRPWVHPGREGLVLPLPTFTLEQFKAFCDWHPTFEWEAIESVFTNDDGTLDEGALKELASRGEAAAAMVCGVLAGADDEYLTAWETSCQIDECRAEIAELKSLKPTTITERAIAKQELEKLESRLTALLNPDAEPSTTESLEPAVPAQQQPETAAVEALPVQPKAAAPATVVAESASNGPSNGLATAQIAALFDAFPYKAEHWSRRLSGTKWLQPAQVALGAAGGATSLWCPATLARLVHARERGPARQKTLEALNRKFKSNPVLEPWRAAWNEHYEMFNDAN